MKHYYFFEVSIPGAQVDYGIYESDSFLFPKVAYQEIKKDILLPANIAQRDDVYLSNLNYLYSINPEYQGTIMFFNTGGVYASGGEEGIMSLHFVIDFKKYVSAFPDGSYDKVLSGAINIPLNSYSSEFPLTTQELFLLIRPVIHKNDLPEQFHQLSSLNILFCGRLSDYRELKDSMNVSDEGIYDVNNFDISNIRRIIKDRYESLSEKFPNDNSDFNFSPSIFLI